MVNFAIAYLSGLATWPLLRFVFAWVTEINNHD